MIGRSHAMLGAAGYLTFVATSRVQFDDTVLIAGTAVAVALTPAFVFLPSGIQAQRTRATYFRDLAYKFMYRVAALSYFSLMLVCLAQWVVRLFPQAIPSHPGWILVWTAVATGWALVPDIDEPKSTIAQEFGALSRRVSWFTKRVAGGHRVGTHSWILVLLALALSALAYVFTPIAGFLVATSFVFAIRVMLPVKANEQALPIMFIAGLVGAITAVGMGDASPMLVAVPLGVLLHDLGDWFTRGGIMFWYPYRKKYGAGAMRTGSTSEFEFGQLIMSVVIVFFVVTMSLFPIIQDPSIIDPSGAISTSYQGLPNVTHTEWKELLKQVTSLLPKG